jgi:4-hydroxy-2-oxoheptanedioate aldolase
MFLNKVKELWANDQPVINGWLSIGNSLTAEIMAGQGYDSLTVDMQHGALDFSACLVMLQVLRGYGVTPMVRVPWCEPGIIMKALDAGAQGIICPMINTAEEAEKFVSYLRYPPLGQRSYGPTRAAFAYGGYGLEANEQILALAMIETAQGIEQLEEIAATPGLDGIYIGPSDLTLGSQGGRLPPGFDRNEPEMVKLIKHILEIAKKYNIRACLHCGGSGYAAQAIEWGFDLTTVSGDTRLLAASAASSVREWRDATNVKPASSTKISY